jgi:pilus assembly protein CpaF
MMGVLVVVAGPAAGRRIDLLGPMTVGRREGEIVLDDAEISRRHCTIAPGPQAEVVVTDLGSTNGTWVNGNRIAVPTVVRPGDELRCGDSVCRLEVPRAAPVAAAPAGAGPPAQPFGAFAPVAAVAADVRPRRGAAATRLPAGVAFVWTVIALDALGLIVYFAAR